MAVRLIAHVHETEIRDAFDSFDGGPKMGTIGNWFSFQIAMIFLQTRVDPCVIRSRFRRIGLDANVENLPGPSSDETSRTLHFGHGEEI
jgi:hypothetical protein